MGEDAYSSLVRRAYQDFESGELDLLRVVMADEVVWHEPGRSSFAGDYKGPEAVLDLLRKLKARSRGTLKIEILDVLSEPERAVVFQRETAMRNGKALDVIAAIDFEIHRGKITEVTVYQADTYRFDEFWEDNEHLSVSSQEDDSDIWSELSCSEREAYFGALPFCGGLPFCWA